MANSSRVEVLTKDAPGLPFLSQGLVVGNLIYCSGQIGVDPKTGKLISGTVKDRTRQILLNLDAVLKAGGSSFHDAVKVNIFLTDMVNFSDMNEVYMTFLGNPKPVRTCVAVKALPMGTDVEIECIALITKAGLEGKFLRASL